MDIYNTGRHKLGMHRLRLVLKACKTRRRRDPCPHNGLFKRHKLVCCRGSLGRTCSRRGSKDIHNSRTCYPFRMLCRRGIRTDILFSVMHRDTIRRYICTMQNAVSVSVEAGAGTYGIKAPICILCCKRRKITSTNDSERACERQRGSGCRHCTKKISRAYALLVLDKQIKINMCRTKERRQQNEC